MLGEGVSKDAKKEETKVVDDGSNLIVNYIPTSVNEDALTNMFAPFGTVESLKIIKKNGLSMGYGFVKYQSPQSAQKAISHLNGYQINEKRLKVGVARPSSKAITRSNLYVSGIPDEWSNQDLQKAVSPYGEVVECRVLHDSNNKSRNVGFARMTNRDAAQAVVDALHQTTPSGCDQPLVVKFADNPYEATARRQLRMGMNQQWGGFMSMNMGMQGFNPPPPPQQPQGNFMGVCLFVYHLPQEATEGDLYQLFAPYGTIYSTKVMKDLQTGRSKGFGFVNMTNENQAQAAIRSLNGYQMGGKYLKVSFKK